MRVSVIELAAQTPAVLDANSGLEAVVGAGGDVFILGDARIARILTVGVDAAEVVEDVAASEPYLPSPSPDT